MATKVYKLRNLQALKYSTTYLGTTIKDISFTPGMGGINFGTGEYTTDNPFIQDALEADINFGKLFTLYRTYDESNDPEVEAPKRNMVLTEPVRKTRRQLEAERKAAEAEATAKKGGKKGSQTKTESTEQDNSQSKTESAEQEPADEQNSVKTFKTVNDAIEYLEEELGVDTTGKSNEELFGEYNIEVKA